MNDAIITYKCVILFVIIYNIHKQVQCIKMQKTGDIDQGQCIKFKYMQFCCQLCSDVDLKAA